METTSLLHDPAFWLLVLFAIPLILRVPIALALGFSALVVVWQWDLGFSMLSYNFFAGIAKFPLLAIPFFILAGYIMERSGIAARIVALMEALVGSMTGGLAVATVAVATFWGAVSGSGPATVAALGLILIPGMARAGYDKAFAAATVSVTSGLAIVIPPSIAFIVYGSVADVSVPALFAAGFVPGIVVALFIMAAVLIISRKRGYRGQPSGKSVGTALKEAFWGVMTPVVILGGIYGGITTPTEAGAIAVVYALFVEVFITRSMTRKLFFEIIKSSVRINAAIFLVVASATALGQIMMYYNLSAAVLDTIMGISTSKVVIMALILVVLLILGTFLEAAAIIMIVTPLLLPVINAIGVDPVHFGIIMLTSFAVGGQTPPVGMTLFVGASIAKISIERLSIASIPYILTLVVMLVIIAFVPQLSLCLI